ncbi:MAG: Flp family type IVb pilin [Vicinamibacterales bacterium]
MQPPILRVWPRAVGWFFRDETGQDLVEYALLSAFIGLAGVGVFELISDGLAATYVSWVGSPDSGVQSLWQPPDPQ